MDLSRRMRWRYNADAINERHVEAKARQLVLMASISEAAAHTDTSLDFAETTSSALVLFLMCVCTVLSSRIQV